MKRRHFLKLLAALGLTACGGDPGFRNTDLTAQGLRPRFNLPGGDGRLRSLDEFRGQAVIVYFGQTRCAEACPPAMRKYASLLRNLRDKEAARVQFVFISLDPDYDTPERADAYARLFNPKFIGLSGDAQQIADVARQFAVTYPTPPATGAAGALGGHGHGAYIVDPQGQLRLALAADALLEPIGSDLQRLLAGQ